MKRDRPKGELKNITPQDINRILGKHGKEWENDLRKKNVARVTLVFFMVLSLFSISYYNDYFFLFMLLQSNLLLVKVESFFTGGSKKALPQNFLRVIFG